LVNYVDSHLSKPELLDAAHIVMDADEQLGQPIVSNRLPLTKLHHAAFDAHLIGIDPDFRIHVSDRLLEIHDGPFLELGLKGIVGQVIQLPRRIEDRPDRERLARRFEEFDTGNAAQRSVGSNDWPEKANPHPDDSAVLPYLRAADPHAICLIGLSRRDLLPGVQMTVGMTSRVVPQFRGRYV
jgi:hypothetical protein